MLCRALIAAVAVTCTLSHAHGQATQRLDRIKDLICVLVLSGMQKEDLDVSLLTKLEQYNVNIDDVNNEEIRQACIQSRDNSSNDKDKKNIEPQQFISTSDVLDDYKTNSAFEVLNRPDNLENLSSNMSTYYKMSNKFHENNNKISKVIEENKSNVDEITQYSEDNLERVLRYLQDERVNKVMKYQPTTQSVSVKEQESKRSLIENLHSSETDTLNRLIANLLTKRINISTKPTTTQKPLNIEDLYEKFISFRKNDMKKSPNVNSGFQRSFVQLPNQENARKMSIVKRIIESESDTKREESKIPNDRNFPDALALLNTYKSFNAFMPDAETASNLKGKTKESLKMSINPYRKFQITERPTTTLANLEQKKEISQDMMKEIAHSVKEMVLRELRRELHETKTSTITTSTITSTTTTHSTVKTESTIQTTLKKENIKTQDSVMNKFLELFEEIKSLKQKTIAIPGKNENVKNNEEIIQNVDIKQVYPQMALPIRTPNNIMQHKIPLNTNQVYGINQYPRFNSENINTKQEHEYKSSGTFKKQELQELNKGLLPITVQTNNIEVPPLSIPLDGSQNLVRQNIIITTMVPHRIIPIKIRNGGAIKTGNQHIGNQQSVASDSFKEYKSKQVHPRPFKEPYKPPAHHFHSNSKGDIIRFTLNNEDSKYSADYYEKINLGKYKRPDSDDIKYQETPRFHEKLENIERYLDYPEENKYSDRKDCCNEKFRHSQVMVDCCNRKIASRQQMSLNNMKKKSYDDTHFKKFLQSQQKVTDMLEKILGDKSSNFQSVETA